MVTLAFTDGPAARAGLHAGDVIVALNGVEVQSNSDYLAALQSLPLGKPTSVRVSRSGREITASLLPERAVPLYSRLCDAGDIEACGTIGYMLQSGSRVRADPSKAEHYLAKACDSGHTPSCVNLGNIYEDGPPDLRDGPRALRVQERACAEGLMAACINVARLIGTSRFGLPVDQARATALYKRACLETDHAPSCRAVAVLALSRLDNPERPRAHEFLQRACDLGDEKACELAKYN
jgi:TPR repeat protein